MKTIFLEILLFLFSVQGFTSNLITNEKLNEALVYGKTFDFTKEENDLMEEWFVKIGNKTNPYSVDEKVIVYTPYLLTALNSYENKKNGKDVSVEEALNY